MRPDDLYFSTSEIRTEETLQFKFEYLAPITEHPLFFIRQWLLSYNWGRLQEVDSALLRGGGGGVGG